MIYLGTRVDIDTHYMYNIKEKKFYRFTKIKLDSYKNSYHKYVRVLDGWLYEGPVHNVNYVPKLLTEILINDISYLETLLLSKILEKI